MTFDPMTLLLLASGIGAASGIGSNNQQFGSTYSKKARSTLDQILDDVRSMKSAQDVTQNPQFNTGTNYLNSLYNDQDFFNRFEAPLQRQFQEQTIPDLANRFASMGSGGSLGSTGFRNQLAREGSNLSTNIGALRAGLQQQSLPQLFASSQQPFQNLLSLLNIGTQPTQNTYQPANAGPFGNIFSSLFGGLSQGYGQRLGSNFANSSPIGNGNSNPSANLNVWDNIFRAQGAI